MSFLRTGGVKLLILKVVCLLKAHLAFKCGCGDNWKLYLYLTYPYHQTLKGKNHVLQLQISQRQDEDASLVYWNNDLSFNNTVCLWTCLSSSTPL
jgi:hypothetical protein